MGSGDYVASNADLGPSPLAMGTTGAPVSPLDSTHGGLYKPSARNSRNLGTELERLRLTGNTETKRQRVRWQTLRCTYRGEVWVRGPSGQIRVIPIAQRLPAGRRRDSINRSRDLVDGRAAMLTSKIPMLTVDRDDTTPQSTQASKLGRRIAKWAYDQYGLAQRFEEVIREGDIDGVRFISVLFDRTKGTPINEPYGPDGQPITDPRQQIAMDAEGVLEWRRGAMGDLTIRTVGPGAMCVDPLARRYFQDARWCCEGRIRSIDDVEKISGKKIEDIFNTSALAIGMMLGTGAEADYSAYYGGSYDDYEMGEDTNAGGDRVKVWDFYHLPSETYPKGLHAMWVDQAYGDPFLVEPYDDTELPYYCYIPRPDGGCFWRSRGVMDDLLPLQVAVNRRVSAYGELLDLYARVPLLSARGALVNAMPYSRSRVVEWNPGMPEPRWMQPPPEPSRLLENINFLLAQMAEIALQNPVMRGAAPGRGVEALGALDILSQNSETQMGGLQVRAKDMMSYVFTRILKLINRHFTIPRMLVIPGVEATDEIEGFQGQMLKGATTVRVIGSLTPRNRDADMARFINFAVETGMPITQYAAAVAENDVDSIIDELRIDEDAQLRENDTIEHLAKTVPNVDQLWRKYQALLGQWQAATDMHADTMTMRDRVSQVAQPQPGEMTVPGMPPSFGAAGLPDVPPPPPRPTLLDIGVPVPVPNEWDNDPIHVKTVDRRRKSEAFQSMHPLVKCAYELHVEMHLQRQAERDSAGVAPPPQGNPGPAMIGAGGPPGSVTQAPPAAPGGAPGGPSPTPAGPGPAGSGGLPPAGPAPIPNPGAGPTVPAPGPVVPVPPDGGVLPEGAIPAAPGGWSSPAIHIQMPPHPPPAAPEMPPFPEIPAPVVNVAPPQIPPAQVVVQRDPALAEMLQRLDETLAELAGSVENRATIRRAKRDVRTGEFVIVDIPVDMQTAGEAMAKIDRMPDDTDKDGE